MDKPITKAEALAAYDGDALALANALGISRSAVYLWGDGPIPAARAMQLRYVLKPEVFGEQKPSEAA